MASHPSMIALAFAATMVACGGDPKRAAVGDTTAGGASGVATSAATASATPDAPAAPGDTTCPMQGAWRPCSVKKRLEGAGLVPIEKPEPVRRAYLSVPGIVYTLGPAAELVAFVYPTREARERESARLDSATAAPKGESGDWKVSPTLMTTNNLLAVLVAQNEQMIERVSLAITAGLPAAEPTTPTTVKGVDVKAKK